MTDRQAHRWIFAALLLCGLPVGLGAQEALVSQFMFDALSVNPASAGMNDYYRVAAGYRNQWPGMPQAYTSYYVSYDQPLVSIHSGAGLQVAVDRAAATFSRTSIEGFYNYRFRAGKLIVAPGLQMAVVQRSLNLAGLTLPDDNPFAGGGSSETLENSSHWFPDFGFGLIADRPGRYTLGLAVHHLNRPEETEGEAATPLALSASAIAYFHVGLGRWSNDKIVFSPGLYFRRQYQNVLSLGLNVAYHSFFVGAWTRSTNSLLPHTVYFLAGIEHDYFRLAYSYDSRLLYGGDNLRGTDAHEIAFTWKIHPRKRKQAVKCSKFAR